MKVEYKHRVKNFREIYSPSTLNYKYYQCNIIPNSTH